MPRNFFIVLVEPKFSENLGSILRVMKNFGFTNLVLVNPRFETDEKVFVSSVWAGDIVFKSMVFNDLNDVRKLCDILIATSARVSRTKSLRKFLSLKSIDRLKFIHNTNVGIVFGREETGLTNEELRKCELLIHIPTNPDYPVLNLSHAVAIVCYEIFNVFNKERDFSKLVSINEKTVFVRALLKRLSLTKEDESFLERILMRIPIYKNEIRKVIGIIKRNK